MSIECTYADCPRPATRVMAMPPSLSVMCHYVAPYCDEHADGVRREGGLPAAGPALSAKCQKIGGIR